MNIHRDATVSKQVQLTSDYIWIVANSSAVVGILLFMLHLPLAYYAYGMAYAMGR